MTSRPDIERIFSEDLYNDIDPAHEQYFVNFFEQMNPLIPYTDLSFYCDFSHDIMHTYKHEFEVISVLNIDLNNLTKGKVLNFQSLFSRICGRNNEDNSFILSAFFVNEGSYVYNFVSSLLYILFLELRELSPEHYETLYNGQ